MSIQIEKARACGFILLASSYCGVTLAEETAKKEGAEAKMAEAADSKSAPIIDYSSVFDNYIPFDETPEIGWKEANDNVGEIGGWRAYAKLVEEEAKKEKEAMKQEEAKKEAKEESSPGESQATGDDK